MFDITEKLDSFLTAFKETLLDYFASFLPYFANQLSPLFCVHLRDFLHIKNGRKF